MPFGWADNRTLLVHWWVGKEWTRKMTKFVGRLDIETGRLSEIAPLPGHEGDWSWSVSHDGRYASIVMKLTESGPVQLWVVDVQSGRMDTLVEKEVMDNYGWFGQNLVFSRERDGLEEIWMVGLKEGASSPTPKFVRTGMGKARWDDDRLRVLAHGDFMATARLFGVTQDGSLYYAKTATASNGTVDLWIMEGFLAKTAAEKSPRYPPTWGPIPVEPLRRGETEIADPKFGISAMLPSGWSIKGANQLLGDYAGVRMIVFSVPNVSSGAVALTYRPRRESDFAPAAGSTPPSADDVAARIQNIALSNYAPGIRTRLNANTRTGTLSARPIGTSWEFTGVVDYTFQGKAWVVCICSHYGVANYASAILQVPADDFDTACSEFKRLTETIRLR